MLQIGDSNGIWLGTFFIAPVVGVGTIVSSAIGFFIFLWHFKNRKKQKKVKIIASPLNYLKIGF